jgi:hypothetical protein
MQITGMHNIKCIQRFFSRYRHLELAAKLLDNSLPFLQSVPYILSLKHIHVIFIAITIFCIFSAVFFAYSQYFFSRKLIICML